MSTPSVSRSARNGHAPHSRTTIVPLLAVKVDHLHRLRDLLAQAQAAEAALTRELLAALQAHGLPRLAGARAIATVAAERRPVLRTTAREEGKR